ncbi:MAG: hypothetical protein OJF50_004548 [Nitrospira sp.]|nr:hypothetical protein [Nitrospira sp.]
MTSNVSFFSHQHHVPRTGFSRGNSIRFMDGQASGFSMNRRYPEMIPHMIPG